MNQTFWTQIYLNSFKMTKNRNLQLINYVLVLVMGVVFSGGWSLLAVRWTWYRMVAKSHSSLWQESLAARGHERVLARTSKGWITIMGSAVVSAIDSKMWYIFLHLKWLVFCVLHYYFCSVSLSRSVFPSLPLFISFRCPIHDVISPWPSFNNIIPYFI